MLSYIQTQNNQTLEDIKIITEKTLIKVLENFTKKQKLPEDLFADEMINALENGQMDLTWNQEGWLKRFINVWNKVVGV